MIEIDLELKKIFFYFSPDEIKKNNKRDDEMHEFELLSGYICPECKKVIDGYYVGELKVGSSSNEYYSHPYLPTNEGYNRYNPHYKYGHNYGGGYIIMHNHNDTLCKYHIASVGGIIEGIKSIINWIVPTPEIVPTDIMLKNFAANVFEKKIPGIYFIKDICDKRSPILSIDKKEFAKNVSYKGLSEFDKEYQFKYLFYLLVIGNQEIKIIENESEAV